MVWTPRAWNYLRVRGEYDKFFLPTKIKMELPPRARRIRLQAFFCLIEVGTTSACAENTITALAVALEHGNYLRVRGEYGALLRCGPRGGELPPRARRIP